MTETKQLATGENIFYITMRNGTKFHCRRALDERIGRSASIGRRGLFSNMTKDRLEVVQAIGKPKVEMFNGDITAINMAEVSSITYLGGFVDNNPIEGGDSREVFFIVSADYANGPPVIRGPYDPAGLIEAAPAFAAAEGDVMVFTPEGEKAVVSVPAYIPRSTKADNPLPPQAIATAVFYMSPDGQTAKIVIGHAEDIAPLLLSNQERPTLAIQDAFGNLVAPATIRMPRQRVSALGGRL